MSLHWRSIPVRVIERFDPALFGAIGVLLTVFNDESGIAAVVAGLRTLLIVVAVYLTLQVFAQTLRWRNFELDVDDDSLVIQSGILRTRRRRVPVSRIQRSSVSRSTVGALFGVAAFECETAGNPDEVDVTVRYLAPDDAAWLRESVAGTTEQRAETDREPAFILDRDTLLLFGTMRLHVRTVALAAVTGIGVLFVSPGPVSGLRAATIAFFDAVVPLPEMAMLALVVGGGWLIGVVLSIERMYSFRISIGDEALRRRHGLLRQYEADLPFDRIQVARVRANPLHRSIDMAQADVGTAGIAGSLPFGLHWPLSPLARTDVIWGLIERTIGTSRPSLEPLPRRARGRYLVRYGICSAALVGVVLAAQQFGLVAQPVALLVASLAFVSTAPAAHVAWSERGYHLGSDHFVVRYGFWSQRTYVIPYANVQDVTISQSPFQRRADLVSIRVDIASLPFLPGVRLSNVDPSVGAEIRNQLRQRSAYDHPATG